MNMNSRHQDRINSGLTGNMITLPILITWTQHASRHELDSTKHEHNPRIDVNRRHKQPNLNTQESEDNTRNTTNPPPTNNPEKIITRLHHSFSGDD